jgi:hypothetical protein
MNLEICISGNLTFDSRYIFLIIKKENAYPNISRRIEVEEIKELLITPVGVAYKNIEDKNVEFESLILSHEIDSNPDTKRLSMLRKQKY